MEIVICRMFEDDLFDLWKLKLGGGVGEGGRLSSCCLFVF